MCGIVGFVAPRPGLAETELIRMRDALAHRGPDDSGLLMWTDADVAAGLAHRRLSIIDLSEAARQPLANEDESAWIVFNGELYDFERHRTDLLQRGHRFRSKSDSEVVLHLYEEYGMAEALRRMNGMFALAIWDARRKQLWLARDRLGKKPLFYTLKNATFMFASEMKALLAGGRVDRQRLDPVAMDQIWNFGVTVGERTLYEEIRKLPPAHYAFFENGQFRKTEYWDCVLGTNVDENRRDEDWLDELEALLRDAIRIRLVADVPVGLFLSGGVDSSLIAALTVQLVGRDLSAYVIGFPEDDFNEAPYAEAVGRHLGLRTEVRRLDQDLFREAGAIARLFDEPFGDSSAVPTYYVSQLTRQSVKVAITGDGGDELFAGYDFIRQAARMWGPRLLRRQLLRPMAFDERLWEWKQRWLGFERAYLNLDRQLSDARRAVLFTPQFLSSVSLEETVADRRRWMARCRGRDVVSRVQYLLLKTWLPDDFLRKVDTVSMANALECRSPLLDYRVAEFAARLPLRLKFGPDGRGKRILRMLLSRYVPEALFNRPKKGFGLPWEIWCQGERGERLRRRWRAWRHPWFRPEAAEMLFPPKGIGVNFLEWTAFATLEHFCPET